MDSPRLLVPSCLRSCAWQTDSLESVGRTRLWSGRRRAACCGAEPSTQTAWTRMNTGPGLRVDKIIVSKWHFGQCKQVITAGHFPTDELGIFFGVSDGSQWESPVGDWSPKVGAVNKWTTNKSDVIPPRRSRAIRLKGFPLKGWVLKKIVLILHELWL